jgi:hypothetical protein
LPTEQWRRKRFDRLNLRISLTQSNRSEQPADQLAVCLFVCLLSRLPMAALLGA